jgi:hypothetical protein
LPDAELALGVLVVGVGAAHVEEATLQTRQRLEALLLQLLELDGGVLAELGVLEFGILGALPEASHVADAVLQHVHHRPHLLDLEVELLDQKAALAHAAIELRAQLALLLLGHALGLQTAEDLAVLAVEVLERRRCCRAGDSSGPTCRRPGPAG